MILGLNFMRHWIPQASFLTEGWLYPDTCNQSLEIYIGTRRLISITFLKFLILFPVCWALTLILGWDTIIFWWEFVFKYMCSKYLWTMPYYLGYGESASLEKKSYLNSNVMLLSAPFFFSCSGAFHLPFHVCLLFFRTDLVAGNQIHLQLSFF